MDTDQYVLRALLMVAVVCTFFSVCFVLRSADFNACVNTSTILTLSAPFYHQFHRWCGVSQICKNDNKKKKHKKSLTFADAFNVFCCFCAALRLKPKYLQTLTTIVYLSTHYCDQWQYNSKICHILIPHTWLWFRATISLTQNTQTGRRQWSQWMGRNKRIKKLCKMWQKAKPYRLYANTLMPVYVSKMTYFVFSGK